ncbi:MAG: hypothetical protein Q9191_002593 [Dirinaria sp. TL-2023a]
MDTFLVFLASLYSLILVATSLHIPFASTLNASTASPENHATVECSEEYGANLDVLDCRNAISHFTSGSTLLPLADREHIMPGDDETLPLPFRMMGNTAHCYVQPVLVLGAISGEATLDQVKAAAARIVAQCAFRPSTGGIAYNIGGDDNIAVIVGKYKPTVTCRGLIPEWETCIGILHQMPAGFDELVFGPPTDPRHDVGLPIAISSEKITITETNSHPEPEALVAVYSVCARHGLAGIHSRIGTTSTPQPIKQNKS